MLDNHLDAVVPSLDKGLTTNPATPRTKVTRIANKSIFIEIPLLGFYHNTRSTTMLEDLIRNRTDVIETAVLKISQQKRKILNQKT